MFLMISLKGEKKFSAEKKKKLLGQREGRIEILWTLGAEEVAVHWD